MELYEGFTIAAIFSAFITMIGALAKWISEKVNQYDKDAKAREQDLLRLIEEKEVRAEDREERQRKEILELRADQRTLEIEIRNELVVLLKDTKEALKENTHIIRSMVSSTHQPNNGGENGEGKGSSETPADNQEKAE